MCVWCAYTGKRRAAPILTECGERIEGLWSGFYTGLVTADEAGLHYGKVTSWSKAWHAKYSPDQFSGTFGLWHSRTNSGGDERWAHPFIGNEGVAAMVSQGNAGVFAGRDAEHMQIAEKMLGEGIKFSSASPVLEWRKSYPALSDNTQIHISDLVIQIIEQQYLKTKDPLASIRFAMETVQEEATNVVIFRDRPGVLYFGTSTQRIVAAEYADGIALSINSLAFGKPMAKCIELPQNCLGCISPYKMEIEKLSPVFDSIEKTIPEGLMTSVRDFLRKNGPSTLAQICDNAIKPLMKTSFAPRSAFSHKCVEELAANGEITITPNVIIGGDGVEGRSDLISLI